jgi:alkanesulfonate monooxygenase SsuD/methylene tetrahydromethanopterin reductase-like flavin-dependent oxidoreductase (luciferase family)
VTGIRFGVVLPTWVGLWYGFVFNERVDYDAVRETALTAEKLGYDSVWAADHLIYGDDGAVLECCTLLSALSSITERIRLGSAVICNSFRYPSVLAKTLSTLDVISKGRIELGMGAGYIANEHTSYGIPWKKHGVRVAQLREALLIVEKLWTDESATFKGKYYSIKDAICEPKPLQKPHPPIWIGGSANGLLKLVAELGYGCNFHISPIGYRERLDVLNQYCLNAGRDFEKIEKSWYGSVVIAPSREQLRRKLERVEAHLTKDVSLKRYEDINIVGTPEECVAKVGEYVKLGVRLLILKFIDFPSLDGLTGFAKQVIPAV